MSERNHISLVLCFLIAFILTETVIGQTTDTTDSIWQEPWEGVPEYYQKWNYPDYQFPANLSTWKNDREKVKATLQDLLGDIPARPAKPKVKTVSREVKNGYILEKFLIDNELIPISRDISPSPQMLKARSRLLWDYTDMAAARIIFSAITPIPGRMSWRF